MVAWLNFAVLVAASVLAVIFYIRSVRPGSLARRIGPAAYARCARYRLVCSAFLVVTFVNYAVYAFYPLPVPLSRHFPWPWPISAAIALLIAAPSGYLMWRGIRDAGWETIRPSEQHGLNRGIYDRLRHPQAVGGLPLWWAAAILLNSPFLLLLSAAYLIPWGLAIAAEERDLALRYGRAYEEYRKRTGMLFPRRRRVPGRPQ